MAKFTKSDGYYNDKYDSATIASLKAFELELISELGDGEDEIKITSAKIRLKEKANGYARSKRGIIEQWKNEDLSKDKSLERSTMPNPPECDCGREMLFFDYDFLGLPTDPHFIFSCGSCNKKNAMLDRNGVRQRPKTNRCNYCNGNTSTKVKRSKTKITTIDTCKTCGKTETIEYGFIKEKKDPPINELERKAYCKNFEGRRSFYEDLKAIANWGANIEKKPDLSEIELLKLPKLEEQLSSLLKENNFINLKFQQPKITDVMTVEFSIQDASDRNDEQAAKALKKLLTYRLLNTNWRLMSTAIVSRMGYLSGHLKGFDQPEHLNKLISERLMLQKKKK